MSVLLIWNWRDIIFGNLCLKKVNHDLQKVIYLYCYCDHLFYKMFNSFSRERTSETCLHLLIITNCHFTMWLHMLLQFFLKLYVKCIYNGWLNALPLYHRCRLYLFNYKLKWKVKFVYTGVEVQELWWHKSILPLFIFRASFGTISIGIREITLTAREDKITINHQ